MLCFRLEHYAGLIGLYQIVLLKWLTLWIVLLSLSESLLWCWKLVMYKMLQHLYCSIIRFPTFLVFIHYLYCWVWVRAEEAWQTMEEPQALEAWEESCWWGWGWSWSWWSWWVFWWWWGWQRWEESCRWGWGCSAECANLHTVRNTTNCQTLCNFTQVCVWFYTQFLGCCKLTLFFAKKFLLQFMHVYV